MTTLPSPALTDQLMLQPEELTAWRAAIRERAENPHATGPATLATMLQRAYHLLRHYGNYTVTLPAHASTLLRWQRAFQSAPLYPSTLAALLTEACELFDSLLQSPPLHASVRCVTITAPAWFLRADFHAWRTGATFRTLELPDQPVPTLGGSIPEYQDVFVIADEQLGAGDEPLESDLAYLPDDIRQAVARAMRAECPDGQFYGIVWIKAG